MNEVPHGLDDPYRLPRHVRPTRYHLMLEPDLVSATFQGRASIALTVLKETRVIVCNALKLAIDEAVVEAGATTDRASHARRIVATLSNDSPNHSPQERGSCISAFGACSTINFAAFIEAPTPINAGANRRSQQHNSKPQTRDAFPCWDEPGFKAVFSTTLVIDESLTAISNSLVVSETREKGKKSCVLPTRSRCRRIWWLLSLVGWKPVLLLSWATPGYSCGQCPARRTSRVSDRTLLQRPCIFRRYYDISLSRRQTRPFSHSGLRLGAMENLGAITFRETALLVDQRTGTHGELQRRVADVVAHENAHLWFGDLVTMSWWNGLWLNEAFATFMEMLAVDAWKPEWKRWDAFGASRGAAFAVDGLHSTRPIEFPVRAPKDAEAMFDVLTYEKGASVLRMLEQHIGPTVFRDGVRDYLRTHAYGNADTNDLWVSIGKASNQAVPDL